MYVDLLFCMFLIWIPNVLELNRLIYFELVLIWIPNVLELNRLVYFELVFIHFVCEYWFELIACKSGGFIFLFS